MVDERLGPIFYKWHKASKDPRGKHNQTYLPFDKENDSLYQTMVKELHNARTIFHISTEAFAEALGISRVSINNIEAFRFDKEDWEYVYAGQYLIRKYMEWLNNPTW